MNQACELIALSARSCALRGNGSIDALHHEMTIDF
tara:strand:+ start:205524 stop:205628 length:105 start_codon:yes stop_codon:yes gene_type:complete